ncbi:MAG: o-succinylbenzoate--CoA ligase, partial [Planctomycetes bacterium]|nr:o-succinylbenzoate--CoA ligase [Planctomycetota bacterium]
SENSFKYASLTAACWQAGAVVVPISTRYPDRKIKQAIQDVGCDKLVVSKKYSHIEAGIKKVLIDDIVECDSNRFVVDDFYITNLDLNADASIIFTSGSSDKPKAVLHTIGNHYYSALGSNANIPFGKGHRWLMTLPMYHVSGFSLIMRAMINGGAIVFPGVRFSINECVKSCDFTHISLVPAQLSDLLEDKECVEKLKQLSAILVGGAEVRQQLIEKATGNGLPIHTTYGSTEAASQITTTAAGDLEKYKGTSGKALEHRQVKISDGRIMVKGKTLFKGYIKNNSLETAVDADGYFATGDLGRFDDAGNLYVTGRTDTMFVSGGENIYPRQIEKVLEKVDGIEQAIVVPVKCDRFGFRPIAFVKSPERIDKKVIEKAVRNELEGFKVPAEIFDMPENTDRGIKPDRNELTELAEKLISKKT